MRVALFVTCVNDAMYPDTGKATVAILDRLGVHVEFPREQTCCGQPHYNSGYQAEAVPLVRRFVRTFADYDVVVSPSASCVSMVHEYYARLAEVAGDATLQADVAALVPRVLELSQVLVDTLGVDDVGAYFPHRVTYHPACHGLRMLHLGDRYVRLLRNTEGLELLDLPRADECCGFGGTFAVKNAGVSSAMVTDKADAVQATAAEVFTTTDNSCLMNIAGALARRPNPPRSLHVAEILACTRETGESWRHQRPRLVRPVGGARAAPAPRPATTNAPRAVSS
jgi:L-lactate dehydrogenase complex protein LldE